MNEPKRVDGLELLVIGLDGATWEVMRPLMDRGELPALRSLMADGSYGPLRSTLPPVTAPAWSGFMTGLNPGKHGIFQWRTYDPTNYTCLDERLMTSERLVGKAFWDMLGEVGYRVAALTVPMTYPVWPVNGFMLAGYPCPDSQPNFGHPQRWASSLPEPLNFQADYYLGASEETIWARGIEMLKRRTALTLDLIRDEGINACVLVLGEIDRAQHDFWQYAHPSFPQYHTPQGTRFRDVIADHYRESDRQVGRLLDAATENTTILVMSDHGAGPHPPKLFNTNAWLESQGWLTKNGSSGPSKLFSSAIARIRELLPFEERLRRILPERLVNGARRYSMNIADIDWAGSRAYRFPMYHPAEGIEINMRGRQPQGVVEPGAEFEALRDEIIDALREAIDPVTGQPIVSEAHRREEIYNGEFADIAPDIVFLTSESFRGSNGLDQPVAPADLGALTKYNGLHRMDGILLARGPGIKPGAMIEDANILDIAPTLLYAMDEPIPSEMDGSVLSDLFFDELLSSRDIRYREESVTCGSPGQHELSAKDDAEMRDKLEGLGYL